MLDEPWAALSGVSGAALACCFVAAALALRWSSRRTARASAVRARQRQKAALDTMDKAAQRFRLQVTAGVCAECRLSWRLEFGCQPGETSSGPHPQAGASDGLPWQTTPHS